MSIQKPSLAALCAKPAISEPDLFSSIGTECLDAELGALQARDDLKVALLFVAGMACGAFIGWLSAPFVLG